MENALCSYSLKRAQYRHRLPAHVMSLSGNPLHNDDLFASFRKRRMLNNGSTDLACMSIHKRAFRQACFSFKCSRVCFYCHLNLRVYTITNNERVFACSRFQCDFNAIPIVYVRCGRESKDVFAKKCATGGEIAPE